ncbi:Potassium transporter 5 [Stylosanthes scabra]|uniref:Potassium transporter 5 n=1 Tax=Stylosanthes scabra TaxID=79078 RepID=A0ABU6ZB23_9FABA|nr:Potassium transporter 5 [Stylosanthes scabra]
MKHFIVKKIGQWCSEVESLIKELEKIEGIDSVSKALMSFSFITCPSILVAYIGQVAFLRKFPEKVYNTFYESIPCGIYWPTFVMAVGAAIIASQAMISGAFSIISQALSLGCFP